MKKWLFILTLIFSNLQTYAFEDYVISSNGKLSDIKIQDDTIVEIKPLVTIMNEKNILLIQPLKTGVTTFTVKRNSNENFIFHIKVEEEKTMISEVQGFKILSIDLPPTKDFELDLPPINIDNPPVLRKKEVM